MINPVMLMQSALRVAWSGPFYVGPLKPPVSIGDALLKILETFWKGAFVLLAGLAAVVLAVFGYSKIDELKLGQSTLRDLHPTIRAFKSPCPKDHPIFVAVVNRGSTELRRVDFRLEARYPGHSTNLLLDEPLPYTMDDVIKPGDGRGYCWDIPKLTDSEAFLDPAKIIGQ